jgi:hypothetical protein
MPTHPERPFVKFSAPGQLKPLDQRIGVGSLPVVEQPTTTLPAWGETQGILGETFQRGHDTVKYRVMTKHWRILHDYYDALFQIAKTKPGEIIPEEEDKMLKFNAKYLDPSSKDHRPRLMNALSPMLAVIENRFPQFRAIQ